MRRNPAKRIVEFLSLSSDRSDVLVGLDKLAPRAWWHLRQWLDDAGLAFYFLQKLKDTNTINAIPAWVLSGLQSDFGSNEQRVDQMSRHFDAINRQFDNAGVRYAAVKGLSLVPDFCANASLRYQADFDYLVDSESLSAARQVLTEIGYVSKISPSSLESIFLLPGTEPSRLNQYRADAPHAVELHLDIWDGDLHRMTSIPRLFSVDRVVRQSFNGFEFPAMADEDALLLQVLHACHHIFFDWIRVSCLYEIAYFLNRRTNDMGLWNRVEQRVGDNLALRELIVVVCKLATKLFAAPLPAIINTWSEEARPAIRLWIEGYSQDWAFSDLPVYRMTVFPTALLARLLRQQFQDDAVPQKTAARQSGSPIWPVRMILSLRKDPSLLLDAAWWKRQALFRRTLFHTMARLRYLSEIPRWRWRNRASLRPTSPRTHEQPGSNLKPGDFAEF